MKRRIHVLSVALLAALTAALLAASAASAAPVDWESVSLSLHEEAPGTVLLVSGTLPASAKLPAEVALSVPAGTQVQWAGEILGGDVTADPAVEYTVAKSGDSDVYSFTLTKARTGQIEVLAPELTGLVGADKGANVSWTSPVGAKDVSISVRMPQGSQVVSPVEGAEIQPGPTGFTYYTLSKENVKAGDTMNLSFTYKPPAAPASAASSNNGTALVAIVFVALAFGALVVVGVRRKSAARLESFDEYEDDETDPVAAESHATAEAPAAAEATPEDAESDEPAPRRASKAPVILVGVVLVAVIGGVLATNFASAPKSGGGQISKEFSQGEACTTTPFKLSQADNAAADKAFAALQTVPGVVRASVYADDPRIEVQYCDSSASAVQIRAALQPTGLLAD